MGNLKETHNVFLRFSLQKHPLCFCGKTLWKSQHMSRNGFFQGKQYLAPAVLWITDIGLGIKRSFSRLRNKGTNLVINATFDIEDKWTTSISINGFILITS